MATTDPTVVVADAGPLIHLDELDCLDLLADFQRLLIPQEVWSEAVRHRTALTLTRVPTATLSPAPTPSPALVALADSLGLHAGERAALALIEAVPTDWFLCDDTAARLAAETMSVRVHGTIGLLVRSIRRSLRTKEQALTLIRDLPTRSTLLLSATLLARVIDEVERG